MGALLLLFISLAYGDVTCITSTQRYNGVNEKTQLTEPFYPNEFFELVEHNKQTKRAKIRVANEFYWVPTKGLKKKKLRQCTPNICVKLHAAETYFTNPDGTVQADSITTGVYPVTSHSKVGYRVSMDSQFVWLKTSQIRTQRVLCGSENSTATATSTGDPKPSTWKFGLEGGFIPVTSSEPIKNLLSTLPAPGIDVNDDAFDSPFIEEVKDGSGWFVGGVIEFPIFWGLISRNSIGYKTRSLEYISRPNPHDASTTFITYDELATVPVTVDSSFVYLSSAIKLSGWKILGLQWQPGVTLGLDYSLDECDVEFRTAPQKLTAYRVPSGYESIEFFYGPRLDVGLGFLQLSLLLNFTSYGMEQGVSLGVLF